MPSLLCSVAFRLKLRDCPNLLGPTMDLVAWLRRWNKSDCIWVSEELEYQDPVNDDFKSNGETHNEEYLSCRSIGGIHCSRRRNQGQTIECHVVGASNCLAIFHHDRNDDVHWQYDRLFLAPWNYCFQACYRSLSLGCHTTFVCGHDCVRCIQLYGRTNLE